MSTPDPGPHGPDLLWSKPGSEPGLSLLVVIPCLNEENTVTRVVSGIPRQIPGIARIEVLVIDDGSTDRTAELARDSGAEVIVHPGNLGLGSTFREAVETTLARGVDILVNIDGDGQFDPTDIPSFVAPVVLGEADMCTASRFLEGQPLPAMPTIKKWGNRGVSRIVGLLTGKRFRDVSCGFRAFSKEALLRMNLFGSFTYTQEAFMDLVFKNLKILEVPVTVRGTREFGSSRVASNLLRYALRSMQIMMRAFISYRPFTLFSGLAAIFAVAGLALLVFLGLHYLTTRAFSPHIWAGFVGGSLTFLAIFTLVIGLIGDMLMRIRMNQENLLYFAKLRRWEEARSRRRTELPPGGGSP